MAEGGRDRSTANPASIDITMILEQYSHEFSLTAKAPLTTPDVDLRHLAAELNRRLAGLSTERVVEEVIREIFYRRLAVVSSFGAEAAVVLQLVAQVDKTVPILFLETGKHFTETLMYRDILIDRFGFTDAREIKPDLADLARLDANGDLWSFTPNLCCHIRKVLPLERALQPFDAWITGRKRYQTSTRAALPLAEAADGKIKINPLANWSPADVQEAFKRFRLPQHPLFDEGYASIGCAPCTRRVETGEDARAGRWAGIGKTECGIHTPDYQI